jgi:hypothetical protein
MTDNVQASFKCFPQRFIFVFRPGPEALRWKRGFGTSLLRDTRGRTQLTALPD